MFGRKQRAMWGLNQRISLGAKDAAWIVRESGEMELIVPKHGENVEIPEDQMMLIGCAAANKNQRLRELVWQLVEEKNKPH